MPPRKRARRSNEEHAFWAEVRARFGDDVFRKTPAVPVVSHTIMSRAEPGVHNGKLFFPQAQMSEFHGMVAKACSYGVPLAISETTSPLNFRAFFDVDHRLAFTVTTRSTLVALVAYAAEWAERAGGSTVLDPAAARAVAATLAAAATVPGTTDRLRLAAPVIAETMRLVALGVAAVCVDAVAPFFPTLGIGAFAVLRDNMTAQQASGLEHKLGAHVVFNTSVTVVQMAWLLESAVQRLCTVTGDRGCGGWLDPGVYQPAPHLRLPGCTKASGDAASRYSQVCRWLGTNRELSTALNARLAVALPLETIARWACITPLVGKCPTAAFETKGMPLPSMTVSFAGYTSRYSQSQLRQFLDASGVAVAGAGVLHEQLEKLESVQGVGVRKHRAERVAPGSGLDILCSHLLPAYAARLHSQLRGVRYSCAMLVFDRVSGDPVFVAAMTSSNLCLNRTSMQHTTARTKIMFDLNLGTVFQACTSFKAGGADRVTGKPCSQFRSHTVNLSSQHAQRLRQAVDTYRELSAPSSLEPSRSSSLSSDHSDGVAAMVVVSDSDTCTPPPPHMPAAGVVWQAVDKCRDATVSTDDMGYASNNNSPCSSSVGGGERWVRRQTSPLSQLTQTRATASGGSGCQNYGDCV